MDFFKYRNVNEEGGAGDEGTPSLVAKYKKMTPGQSSTAPARQPARKGDKLTVKDEPKRQGVSENTLDEKAPVAPSLMRHRIGVTVSSPDHPMVSKRGERIQKFVIVKHSDDKEGAKKAGEKYYRKRGYRVHDSYHTGVMKEETDQIDELSKATLASYKKKAGAHASAMQKAASDVAASDARPQDKTAVINTLMKKGDKRYSGIVRATKKEFGKTNEAFEDPEAQKAEMALTKLHFIKYAAEEIMDYIEMDAPIEEWYQIKLAKVHADMEGLHSYMEGEKRRTGMVDEATKKMKGEDPCWKGYEMVGTKMKGGKEVPNCVPKESVEEKLDPSMGAGEYVKDFQKSDAPQFKGKTKKERQKMAVAAYLAAKRGE